MTTPNRLTGLNHRLHRAVLAVVVAVVGLVGAGAGPAAAKGGDVVTVAQAEATAARRYAFDSEVEVRTIRGTAPVSPKNYAAGYSHDCTGCKAAAFSIQVVLASGGGPLGSPENVSVALNERCEGCDTVADARQFVVLTDKPVRLSDKGASVVESVRHRVADLRNSGLDGPTMVSRFQAEADRVAAVLSTELRPENGEHDTGHADVSDHEHHSFG
ncbi:MAG: hypothetical protein QOJ69_1902 [Actinomycetota bacterium]|nr:hypothetical protein [Actinomycetota bacterium]